MSTSWDIACVPCSEAKRGDATGRFPIQSGLDDCRYPDDLKVLITPQHRPWIGGFGATLALLEAKMWWLDRGGRSDWEVIDRSGHDAGLQVALRRASLQG